MCPLIYLVSKYSWSVSNALFIVALGSRLIVEKKKHVLSVGCREHPLTGERYTVEKGRVRECF